MAEQSAGRPRSEKLAVTAAVLVFAGLVVASWVALTRPYNSYFYGTYVCTH
ncbi:MAG: hypothetical protein JSV65_08035 [Armatimonadota bacterium]|nr:MAG: hypothetical protein JSV65_08035 [Armatimonadota bacterium]